MNNGDIADSLFIDEDELDTIDDKLRELFQDITSDWYMGCSEDAEREMAAWLFDNYSEHFKQLVADEMLGLICEDQPEFIDDYPFEYGKQYGRNELRNELRTKLAKWLNQPTVNQSASVSRSDEGGESTKGDEK